MANPFEHWYKKNKPVPEGQELASGAEKLRALEERRDTLIGAMENDRHPDDARLLENLEQQIAMLKGGK
ncbi:MAG: hypothetical protein Q8P36_01680 [bacterium]|nr:hypothetical protein [bacterium]